MARAFWLVKSEPTVYSWERFAKDKRTVWDGIRSFEARNNLRAMKQGDLVFFYHSNQGKEIVGVASVASEASPEDTTEGDWSVVELACKKPLTRPVTLAQIKADKRLADFGLVRRSRLSVVSATEPEFLHILSLSGTKL